MLVSGGVDSTVCAALLHKALNKDQVIAFHIDNGFMRKNESEQVEKSLKMQGLDLKGTCAHHLHRNCMSFSGLLFLSTCPTLTASALYCTFLYLCVRVVVKAAPQFYNATTMVPVDKKDPSRKRPTVIAISLNLP